VCKAGETLQIEGNGKILTKEEFEAKYDLPEHKAKIERHALFVEGLAARNDSFELGAYEFVINKIIEACESDFHTSNGGGSIVMNS
ncbi:unnamed protein product, partial [marine sediment metagenome]